MSPLVPHRLTVRVYFEDTDAGGIVYHANYLKFAERARSEMVRVLGLDQRALLEKDGGFVFAVRRATLDCLKPARLDDLLEVESRIVTVGGASLGMEQTIGRPADGAVIARVDVGLAFISLAGRPARMPAELRARLCDLVTERR